MTSNYYVQLTGLMVDAVYTFNACPTSGAALMIYEDDPNGGPLQYSSTCTITHRVVNSSIRLLLSGNPADVGNCIVRVAPAHAQRCATEVRRCRSIIETDLTLSTPTDQDVEATMDVGPCLPLLRRFGTATAPTVVGQEVLLSTCIWTQEYFLLVGLAPGATYRMASCGDVDYDNTLTIRTALDGPVLAFNDNTCSRYASLISHPAQPGSISYRTMAYILLGTVGNHKSILWRSGQLR